jgi:glycosyltransferase involved in cell wall biosynthesis
MGSLNPLRDLFDMRDMNATIPFPRERHRPAPPGDEPRLAIGGRSLKVCITSRAPYIGGAELAAERLAVGLREQGHDVFFLLGKRGEVMDRYEAAGFRCMYFPVRYTSKTRFWRYFAARTSLRSLFKREQVDVVHANDLPSAQLFFDAARGVRGVEGRDIACVCHHRFLYDRDAIDWFNKFGADRHVFVSHALMDELCSRSPNLAASERSVVYDGLPMPPKALKADRVAAKVELGYSAEQPVVLFAGQIIERKGVADLLRAWAILQESGRANGHLVVVGDDLAGGGAYRTAMERLANELHISPRFVGFQKNVDRWLAAADIAVVPSHVEPLGNATLEAMSHGLPVVGANVGGIPEMIVDEETGLLVPAKTPAALAGAIDRLIGDVELREALGAAGRIRCETLFSLKAHANAVSHQYLLAAAGGRQLRKAA